MVRQERVFKQAGTYICDFFGGNTNNQKSCEETFCRIYFCIYKIQVYQMGLSKSGLSKFCGKPLNFEGI